MAAALGMRGSAWPTPLGIRGSAWPTPLGMRGSAWRRRQRGGARPPRALAWFWPWVAPRAQIIPGHHIAGWPPGGEDLAQEGAERYGRRRWGCAAGASRFTPVSGSSACSAFSAAQPQPAQQLPLPAAAHLDLPLTPQQFLQLPPGTVRLLPLPSAQRRPRRLASWALLRSNLEGPSGADLSRQLGSATSRAGARCRQSKPALKRPAGATQQKWRATKRAGRLGAGWAGRRFQRPRAAADGG